MTNELLQTARNAAKAGGLILNKFKGQKLKVTNKAKWDFVTRADKESEEAVLEVITKKYPDHKILAEESAKQNSLSRTNDILWIVDPLDGTTNFIHGIDHYCVSVAAVKNGEPIVGVVLDVAKDEEFYAAKGQGAWLNKEAIKVSPQSDKEKAILLTGFPFRNKKSLDNYMLAFKELFSKISGVRRIGSAALDLAYVACGRAEGFWELGLQPWDVAAGMILVQEAGGKNSDFTGGDGCLWNEQMVSANKSLHPWIQEVCGKYLV